MSSGSPISPHNGVCRAYQLVSTSAKVTSEDVNGVCVPPGDSGTTLIRRAESSAANAMVYASRAPFVAAYADIQGCALVAAVDVMLQITPVLSGRCGSTSRHVNAGA